MALEVVGWDLMKVPHARVELKIVCRILIQIKGEIRQDPIAEELSGSIENLECVVRAQTSGYRPGGAIVQ